MSYIFHPVGRPTETPRPEDAALPSYYFRSRVSSKNCTNFRENYNIVFYFRLCTIYSNNIYARTAKTWEKPQSPSFSESARRCSSSSLRSCSYFNTRPPPEVKPTLDETWCSGTLRIGCSSRGCPLGVSVVLIEENKLPPSDMGVRDPLLPSGTPPPLGIEFTSPKMRDLLLTKCGTYF